MARKNHRTPEQAQNAILDASEALLAEVGPAGLRLSQVAKRAGMAHPNILHHFGSRDALISAVALRHSERTTQRITDAIEKAAIANPKDRVRVLTEVLDTVYPDDEGRLSVWLHMSGVEVSLKDHMERIVAVAQKLRETLEDDANPQNTQRLVLLVTFALLGEAVSSHGIGSGFKAALGFGSEENSRAHFHQWLAEIMLNLNDEQLNTSLSRK